MLFPGSPYQSNAPYLMGGVRPQRLGWQTYDPTKLNPAAPMAPPPAQPTMKQALAQDAPKKPMQQQTDVLAQALLAEGNSGQPINSPVELLGRLAQVASGNYAENKYQTQQKQKQLDTYKSLSDALAGGGTDWATVLNTTDDPAVAKFAFEQLTKGLAQVEPFTLNEGDVRYGPDGKPIASNPKPQAATKPAPRPATLDEKAALGVDPKAPVFIDADGTPHMLSGGGVTVNNNTSTPDKGFRFTYDDQGRIVSEEPIPGSPAATEAATAADKAVTAKATTDIGANVVVQDVDRVIKAISDNPNVTTGLGGSLTQGIPGLPAYDAHALIETIKANSAFDKLQAMRNASPTGGALGNVSDAEGRLLAAAIGNLELSQSSGQLIDNLRRVKNIYLDIIHGPGNGPQRETLGFQAPATGAPPPAQKISGDDDYAKLPSGAHFIGPDGKERIKP